MKVGLRNILMRRNRSKTAFEVEEELQFHVKLLEQKYAQQGISDAQAKAAALERFGNFEKIRRQCMDIRRRNTLLRRVLKTSALITALTGLAIHTLSSDYRVARIGTMLIMIAIAGRLLLYVRGLSPWTKTKTSLSVVTDTPKDAART